MPKSRIVVVGSSNTDMVVRLPRLPRPGETALGGAFDMVAGGKGANQAVSAARAGGSVTFIAKLGSDVFGDEAVAGFARDEIDVRFITRHATERSGVALIFVGEQTGENCIAVASGANARLSTGDIKRAKSAITQAEVLILQLETPLATVRAAATLAVKAGAVVILNPAPACPLPDALLRQVDVITPNETEAEILTGIRILNLNDAGKACDLLMNKGIGNAIITLGRRGSFVATPEGGQLVPGLKVKPLDATGAGDVYNGALAVALGEGRSLLEAARFATAAAAISVTRAGAQPSAPTRREIDSLLRRA